MAQDKTGWFRQIFLAMMIFTALVWIWTVVFIMTWPWDKNAAWKPEFRLPAVCANGEICGLAYGDLEAAKAKGTYTSLAVPGDNGEVQEANDWLRWKKGVNQPWQIEAKTSSWYFQTVIRYRLENETPVLVEYQDVSAKAFYYGMAAALFSLIGIYLRKLRG